MQYELQTRLKDEKLDKLDELTRQLKEFSPTLFLNKFKFELIEQAKHLIFT